ncbi:MAG: DUF4012 domain-containing protein [Actinobacteria bacterium]|nr:MAG: DUF4012 domain-containing protein [Actinomycetota bacterium]
MSAQRAAAVRAPARPVSWRERLAARTWRFWVAVAGVAVVAIVLLAVVQLVRAEHRLSRARTSVLAAEVSVRQGAVEQARRQLSSAIADISAANLTLHNDRALTLVSYLPVANQNVTSLRRSVGLLLEMADGGRQLLGTVAPLEDASGKVNVPLRNGALPLDVVVNLRSQLNDFAFSLPGPSEAPGGTLLIGPVRHLQSQVYSEAARRRGQFASVASGLELLSEMSGANGPRRYLLAVANAAEMRGTGGMILSYGVLSSAGGKFTLDKVGPIDDLILPHPATPNPVPAYVSRFAEFTPTLQWRNANLGADYQQVAPVMAAMYQTATGNPVDGVIQIDSMGLSALLRGTGPVTIPDLGEVNADNAVALTLNQAYTQFPDRPIRQEYLGQIANAGFRKLLTGDYPSLRDLGRSLSDAVDHRNVIFWSSHDSGERPAAQLHADGPAPDTPDFAQLTVQNLTGNKLDYYLDTGLRLQGSRPSGGLGHVRVQIDLHNTATRDGRPPYVFGPEQPRFQPGQYEGLVSLYVPSGTSLSGSSGLDQPKTLSLGAEGDRSVVTFRTTLQAGDHRVVTLDLTLTPRPPGPYRLELVPAPRVRPTTVAVDMDVDGNRARYNGALLAATIVR